MKEVIYYRFKKGFWAWTWLIFDIAALAVLFKCLVCYSSSLYIWQFTALLVIISAHLGVWLYKFGADNEMAVITDKDITIDHNAPLAWKDIAYAEETLVKCCGKNRKVLSLVARDGIDYKYNWLQNHNPFPAFSIPLYGIISKEDEEKITKIIDKKVGIKSAKAAKEPVAKKKAKSAPKTASKAKTNVEPAKKPVKKAPKKSAPNSKAKK